DEEDELSGMSDFVSSLRETTTDPTDLIRGNPIKTPAAVVQRSFYEKHGGFNSSLIHAADWDVWVRAVLHGGGRMLNKPLAFYRMWNASHSIQVNRSADSHRDCLRLARIWQKQGLPGFDYSAYERAMLRQVWNDWRQYVSVHDDKAAA